MDRIALRFSWALGFEGPAVLIPSQLGSLLALGLARCLFQLSGRGRRSSFHGHLDPPGKADVDRRAVQYSAECNHRSSSLAHSARTKL